MGSKGRRRSRFDDSLASIREVTQESTHRKKNDQSMHTDQSMFNTASKQPLKGEMLTNESKNGQKGSKETPKKELREDQKCLRNMCIAFCLLVVTLSIVLPLSLTGREIIAQTLDLYYQNGCEGNSLMQALAQDPSSISEFKAQEFATNFNKDYYEKLGKFEFDTLIEEKKLWYDPSLKFKCNAALSKNELYTGQVNDLGLAEGIGRMWTRGGDSAGMLVEGNFIYNN